MTDQDILKTISYITDNKYIATYHGVDVKRVTALRDKMKKGKEKKKVEAVRPEVEHATTAKPNANSMGLNSDSERKWNANAKAGSAALLKALLKFFDDRERRLRGQSK
jgi:hypothetical protein